MSFSESQRASLRQIVWLVEDDALVGGWLTAQAEERGLCLRVLPSLPALIDALAQPASLLDHPYCKGIALDGRSCLADHNWHALVRWLRSFRLPAIVYSSSTEWRGPSEELGQNLDGFVASPFRLDGLLAALDDARRHERGFGDWHKPDGHQADETDTAWHSIPRGNNVGVTA